MILYGLILYGTLFLCGFGILAGIRRYDVLPREPWFTMLTALFAGAGLMHLAGRIQVWIVIKLYSSTLDYPSDVTFAFLAGSVEEAAKFAAVILVALIFRRWWDEYSDGLVYGAMAGLGAAIEESVHMIGFPDTLQFLPLAEPVRLAGHLIMGAISCAGLGLWAAKDKRAWWGVPFCFFLGFGLHFLWDVVAFETSDHVLKFGKPQWSHNIAAIGLMLIGMLVFRYMAWKAGVREPSQTQLGRSVNP